MALGSEKHLRPAELTVTGLSGGWEPVELFRNSIVDC